MSSGVVVETMDVSLLSKGVRYEVQSASGNRYEVDIIDESCICTTGSSAHPRAAASTFVASITRSNGAAFPAQTAAFLPRRVAIELLHRSDRVAIPTDSVER